MINEMRKLEIYRYENPRSRKIQLYILLPIYKLYICKLC
eukprot:UN09257